MRSALAAVLALVPLAAAPARDAPLDNLLEDALAAAVDAGDLPGGVLRIGRGEAVLAEGTFGALGADRGAPPLDAVYDLASLTKPVATATAIVQLADRGKLDLGRPVALVLPEFGAAGKGSITPEMLLLHRSGLVPDDPLADYADGPEEAWRRICALTPESAPGSTFSYSDVGYIVLGELVRAVDGRPLDVYTREELFEPLGMRDTTFRPGGDLRGRCAPTESVDGRLLTGEVHDPRARALGGVAGHAGLFSTAADLSRWCRMLLSGGALDGTRVLSERAVSQMLRARWLPDGSGGRALGLDVDTRYSPAPRGPLPRGASLGHTGFTGTSLWLDPETGGYAILLTNRVHPAGGGSATAARRAVAEAAARLLRPASPPGGVLAGVDVLLRDGWPLAWGTRVGLLSHRAARARDGRRTLDVLAETSGLELVRVFTPEHGFDSDREGTVADGRDARTGIPVVSLYGDRRRPAREALADLDALVVDLQNVGVRFYTYGTTLGYALEACAEAGVRVVVLDRPDPLGSFGAAGPLDDGAGPAFLTYGTLPVLPGLTLGELARLFRADPGIACELEVVPVEGWTRSMPWAATGLPWIAPSPNLRNPTAAELYPALGLLEATNVSVGRGTDQPFERLGAPWIDGVRLADALRAHPIPGLLCTPLEFVPREGPFAGEPCGGVHVALADRARFRPIAAGLALAWHLNRLYGETFEAGRVEARLGSHAAWEAWMRCADPLRIEVSWADETAAFEALRRAALLYE